MVAGVGGAVLEWPFCPPRGLPDEGRLGGGLLSPPRPEPSALQLLDPRGELGHECHRRVTLRPRLRVLGGQFGDAGRQFADGSAGIHGGMKLALTRSSVKCALTMPELLPLTTGIGETTRLAVDTRRGHPLAP